MYEKLVAPAADEYSSIPETPCPIPRTSVSIELPVLLISDFKTKTVRRELKDEFADFELIGRKLSNVNIGEQKKAIELSPIYAEKLLSNLAGLHRAFQSQVVDYQLNAVKLMRSALCDDTVNENTELLVADGFLNYFVDCLSTEKPAELQYEACWCITNIAAGKSTYTRAVVDAGLVPELAKCLYSPYSQVRTQAAWALGNIAGDCTALRDIVVDTGCIDAILSISNGTFDQESRRSGALHVSVWTVANICRWKNFDWSRIAQVYPFIRKVLLSSDDNEMVSECCWAMSRIFHSRQITPSDLIDRPLCERMVQLLAKDEISITTPILRAITNIISSDDDFPTQLFIESALLVELRRILELSVPHIKLEVLLTLSNIAAGTVSQIQSIIDHKFIPVLVEYMREPRESRFKKEACWTISNALVPKDSTQVLHIAEHGVLALMIEYLEQVVQQDDQIIWKATQCIINILESGGSADNIYVKWLRSQDAIFISFYKSFDTLRKRQSMHWPWSSRSLDLLEGAFQRWFGDLACKAESVKLDYFQMLNAIEKVSINNE